MDRTIRCDCGFVATGENDDELVACARAHAHDAHDIDMSADLVLGLTRAQGPPPPPASER